ncbi:MAG: hypothetical protein RR653_06665, partial [Clostridia bacterium]
MGKIFLPNGVNYFTLCLPSKACTADKCDFAEMAFRGTGVGTAPHTGTYSFGAKEYAENSGT